MLIFIDVSAPIKFELLSAKYAHTAPDR